MTLYHNKMSELSIALEKNINLMNFQEKANLKICQICKKFVSLTVWVEDFLKNNNLQELIEKEKSYSHCSQDICKKCITLLKHNDIKLLSVNLIREDLSGVPNKKQANETEKREIVRKNSKDAIAKKYFPSLFSRGLTYFCEDCKIGGKCCHVSNFHGVLEPGMLYCAICPYKTAKKHLLRHHMIVHKAPTQTKKYKCSDCKFETKHYTGLWSHKRLHKKEDELRMYYCSDCNFGSKHRNSIIKHVKIHKKMENIQTHDCNFCEYKSKSLGDLNTHSVIHKPSHLVKWYHCSQCTYKTSFKSNLVRHFVVHRDPKEARMIKCQYCNYKSKYFLSMQKHLWRHGKGNAKVYNCNECNYETKHRTNYLRHILAHKKYGEVPMLKCSECDYETNNKSCLKFHYNNQHNPNAERFSCPHCKYDTTIKGNLKKHVAIHETDREENMNSCPYCDSKSKNKYALKIHIRNFHASKPHKACPYCNYKTPHSIKRHITRVHGKSIKSNTRGIHLRKYKSDKDNK